MFLYAATHIVIALHSLWKVRVGAHVLASGLFHFISHPQEPGAHWRHGPSFRRARGEQGRSRTRRRSPCPRGTWCLHAAKSISRTNS